ncbi:hypothetical protein DEJ04_17385 [Curtobacterium sp. MCLR17_044]|nr:hypothetical protein DEJ04_17385 [Curtobacterium sp. MCLR17_044]
MEIAQPSLADLFADPLLICNELIVQVSQLGIDAHAPCCLRACPKELEFDDTVADLLQQGELVPSEAVAARKSAPVEFRQFEDFQYVRNASAEYLRLPWECRPPVAVIQGHIDFARQQCPWVSDRFLARQLKHEIG